MGPQSFDYRLNGVTVQSYWSANTFDATAPAGAPLGACIVPTGQRQDFYVNAAGLLTVVGDQIGPNDTITLSVGANGGITATENGETAQFDPSPTSLRRVTVSTGIEVKNGAGVDMINILKTLANDPVSIDSNGNTTVNVTNGGTVQNILGDVSMGNMAGSLTTLNVDDSADDAVRAVTMDANMIKGLAPATIFYDDAAIKALNVKGGSGNNFIVVNSTPNNAGNPITTLDSGGGNDVVAVHVTLGALVINGDAGMDAVTLGNGPAPTLGVQGILGCRDRHEHVRPDSAHGRRFGGRHAAYGDDHGRLDHRPGAGGHQLRPERFECAHHQWRLGWQYLHRDQYAHGPG